MECPGCGGSDPKDFELPENFNNIIMICKSKKCSKKNYCLRCKTKIKEDEIYDHMMNLCKNTNMESFFFFLIFN